MQSTRLVLPSMTSATQRSGSVRHAMQYSRHIKHASKYSRSKYMDLLFRQFRPILVLFCMHHIHTIFSTMRLPIINRNIWTYSFGSFGLFGGVYVTEYIYALPFRLNMNSPVSCYRVLCACMWLQAPRSQPQHTGPHQRRACCGKHQSRTQTIERRTTFGLQNHAVIMIMVMHYFIQ